MTSDFSLSGYGTNRQWVVDLSSSSRDRGAGPAKEDLVVDAQRRLQHSNSKWVVSMFLDHPAGDLVAHELDL